MPPREVGIHREIELAGVMAVLDEHVDTSEAFECAVDELFALLVGREVHRRDERLGADLAHLAGDLLEIGLTARAEREVRALRREPQRDAPAHAGTDPGDDRNLVVEHAHAKRRSQSRAGSMSAMRFIAGPQRSLRCAIGSALTVPAITVDTPTAA